jgi:chromosome segregation ATPase
MLDRRIDAAMPRRNPPRGPQDSAPVDDVLRAHGVVLEDIRSRMEMVVEAVTLTRTELKADLRGLDERLSARISTLEEAVRENSRDILKNTDDIRQNSADIRQNSADIRQNSADIRQNSADIGQNSADIRTLREQIAGLRHDFDHRGEIGRLTGLEARVAAIETRLATRT